jgi:hypothetical protein
MAHRLAVMLAVASILVAVCAADSPAMETAATQKYDKKPHTKHAKHDDNKPDNYKPDSYKPDYKPDGYNQDGYKPDEYNQDGYKPDEYNPDYKPDGYRSRSKHNKHYSGYHGDKSGYYEDSYGYNSYGSYQDPDALPPVYDSGYYAGNGNGRQLAFFDVILPENLLNTNFTDNLPGTGQLNCNEANPDGCRADWGLICGLRSASQYGPRPDKSFTSHKLSAAISGTPVKPLAVGKGLSRGYLSWQTLEDIFNDGDLLASHLVVINDNQRAYQVGQLDGFINFVDAVEDCHPAFTGNTRVRLDTVPIYLMMARAAIPTDPASYATLIPTPTNLRSSASSSHSSSSHSSCDSDDGTLCGLALVAKGPVTIRVFDNNAVVIRRYTANIEFVTGWSNGDISVPRLNQEDDRPIRSAIPYWEATVLDRACMYNDIPLVRPGSLRLDFVRELEVAAPAEQLSV